MAARSRTSTPLTANDTHERKIGLSLSVPLQWITRSARLPSSGAFLLATCAVLSVLGMLVVYHTWIWRGPCSLLVVQSFDRSDVLAVRHDVGLEGRRDVTLVTAYLNIGTFNKGDANTKRNKDTYRTWIRIFSKIRNPVVAYFDDRAMTSYFRKLRRGLPTKTHVIDRSTLWAFSLKSETEAVFNQEDYPKNEPKSTNADYVCVMHAKFEFVTHAVEMNYFGTEHFAWLDVGLFRSLAESGNEAPFSLAVPLCHNPLAVAYAAVQPQSDSSVADIMREGIDWVSGSSFLATNETMLAFAADYRRHAETLLRKHRLANADQAVIHAMYSPFNQYGHSVPLQTFLPQKTNWDPWFHLGYLMRQLSMDAHNAHPNRLSRETCDNEMFD